MGNKIKFDFNKLTSDVGVTFRTDAGRMLDGYTIQAAKGLADTSNSFLPGKLLGSAGRYLGRELVHSQMPMNVRKIGDTLWTAFPLEPLVSVSSRNVIVRRNVAKAKEHGTIKERWSQDDFEVTIQGILTHEEDNVYPSGDIEMILSLFRETKAIEVDQAMLLSFGIKFLAIQSIHFPHTKGINNQQFEIKAYSDTQEELLINS
ncbi:MAG: DUF6046 domain-containing protein [Tannerellaceae bacterium]|nr:DUF6046 domain-containing protein [Tannerellaceae bacterium]